MTERSGCNECGYASNPCACYDEHSDYIAIDRFAKAMKEKMAKKRKEGRGGWQTCNSETLSKMLVDHISKGDPVDIGNFAMMLFCNGQSVTATESR